MKKTKHPGIYERYGAYTVYVEIGRDPQTGKRKQISKGGFNTIKDAKLYRNTVQSEVENKTHVNEKKITFEEFSKMWMENYAKSVKVSTVRVRNHELNNLYKYFAQIPMRDITKLKYQKALNKMSETLSHRTVAGIHITAGMVFKKAIEWEVMKNNPAEFAKVANEIKTVDDLEDQEIKFLEKEELGKLLSTAKELGLEHDYLMFSLLAFSGMRVGEMLALKWSDIDFKSNTISIKKTLYNPTNNLEKYELLTPKTKASIRTISIDQSIIDLLRRHKKYQNEQILANGYKSKDFIIMKKEGYPELQKTVNSRMQRLMKGAGINKQLTPHSLRHTHASLLIEAKAGLNEIKERLGHGDINTTSNIYTHITKNVEEKTSQQFAKLMKGLL